MTRDDDMHEALSALVPRPPQAPGRAAAARALHRRHRRRMIGGGAALAALAVIAVPLAVVGTGGDSDRDATVADPGAASSIAAELTCPEPVTDGPLPELTGSDALPEGAVAVLMCNPGGGMNWQAPADALTEEPEALVDLVNSAPLQTPNPNQACTMDLGPTWGFQFGYPDGSTRFIRAESHGCGGVFVGDGARGDNQTTQELVGDFNQRLLDQRLEADPPSPAPAVELNCEQGFDSGLPVSLLPIQPPLELADALLCWSADGSWDPNTSGTAQVGADDLAVLVDDLNANAGPPDDAAPDRGALTCADDGPVDLRIAAATAWGDRILLISSCGTFDLSGDGTLVWSPSPDAEEVLDRLIS